MHCFFGSDGPPPIFKMQSSLRRQHVSPTRMHCFFLEHGAPGSEYGRWLSSFGLEWAVTFISKPLHAADVVGLGPSRRAGVVDAECL